MMKRIYLLGWLLIFAFISIGQRTSYLSINGQTMPVDNLILQDSLTTGGIAYTASVSMNLNEDPATPYILNALQKGNVNISIFYVSVNGNFERQYRNAFVVQLELAKLDAFSRNGAKLELKFRSAQMTETTTTNFVYKNKPTRVLMASNFVLALENLPSNAATSVTGLELKNNSMISLEIGGRDLNAWKEWFNATGKKRSGSIALMSANMKDKIMQFNLSNAELIAITQNINSNDNTVERLKAVLKVATISMENPK